MKHHRRPLLAALSLALLGLLACSGGGPPEPAATPEGAFDRITRGLGDRQPQVVWDALPASYQQDVEGLVHQTAEAADEELWNRSFEVLQKLTRVLREKKNFILEHPMVAMQTGGGEEASRGWDAGVDAIDTLVRSDLSRLDRVKQLDVRAFLGDTGARLMEKLAEAETLAPPDMVEGLTDSIEGAKATVLSQEGHDRAVVRIEAPDQEPIEEPWVRVEGKWIPESWTEDWDANLARVREGLSRMSADADPASKQQALLQLTMVDSVLDQLLAAETAEEFNATMGTVLAMILGGMG